MSLSNLPSTNNLWTLHQLCWDALEGTLLPKPLGLLSDMPHSEECRGQRHRLAVAVDFKNRLKKQAAYIKLHRSPSFEIVEKKISKFVNQGANLCAVKREYFEAQFFYLVSFELILFIGRNQNLELFTRNPNRRTIRSAKKHLVALKILENRGLLSVKAWNGFSTELDKVMLTINDCAPPEKSRSRRNDINASGRDFVERLAYSFLVHFDDPLRQVQITLANMIDYTLTVSAIDERIKTAKQRLIKARRKAL